MRLKKVPHAEAFLAASGRVIYLEEDKLVADPVQASEQRIELEIGCGKGDFILGRAAANPETTYYAIEKFDSVLFRAVEKVEPGTLPNMQFILGDAEHLEQMFVQHSLDRIFLNFSDPWPKTRHAKRRLTYRTKLEIYANLLKESGVLELKTDNQSLFESTLLELSHEKWTLDEVSINLYENEKLAHKTKFQTEYEKKFVAKGMPIYYLKAHIHDQN